MRRIALSTGVYGFSILLASVAHAQLVAAVEQQPTCDRSCLIQLADTYLDSLATGDPSALTWSPNVRFVENARRIRVGGGLWRTMTAAPIDFRIHVPDPDSQQIGVIAMIEENDSPAELGLRLKLRDGEIDEVEHLIARDLRDAGFENLQYPRPALLTPIPISERVSRAAMLDIGYSYYVALDNNNGSASPFAADCVRHENGIQKTGTLPPEPGAEIGFSYFDAMGCKEQLDTRAMSYIDTIDHRRVDIADVETGLVFGLSQFRHSMTNRTIKIVGVPGVETMDVDFDPFDLRAAHIFKVRGGEIHEIEAMGFVLPYNSQTGWE